MDSISQLVSGSKDQDLKRKLLECLDKEARQFSEVARSYFERNHLSKEDRQGMLTSVITTIDHVLAAGDWNSSLFLRNTIKPLMAIKSEAEIELSKLEIKAVEKSVVVQAIAPDEREVYISLFQSDGYNTGKWAMQLRSLERYVIGRPVYQHQEDAEKRVRLRAATGSEGFVVVIIKETDLQSPVSTTKDQFDSPLLSLKETALRNGRIVAFVHQNVRYHFVDGQLIKQG